MNTETDEFFDQVGSDIVVIHYGKIDLFAHKRERELEHANIKFRVEKGKPRKIELH